MTDYRISARAIIIDDNRILLNEFDHGKYYNLPGGGVEIHETIRQAVERELFEESGYTVRSHELLYVFEYNPIRDDYKYGKRGALSHVFRCVIDKEISQEVVRTFDRGPKSVSTGTKWIALENLSKINLVPEIADLILKNHQDQNIKTEFIELAY